MKQRQEVPRPLAIGVIVAIAIMLLIIIFAPQVKAQTFGKPSNGTKFSRSLQAQNSWGNYQASYRKEMIRDAKESRKASRNQRRLEIDRQRFLAKIEKVNNS